MYSKIKVCCATFIICTFSLTVLYAQEAKQNNNTYEIGLIAAGDESIYYGAYGKYTIPLSESRNHFIVGASFTSYFDFKGESTSEAYLKNDIDARLIPNILVGYALNFSQFQLNFEVPLGMSLAITKGTLVNEKIGFEHDYSNHEAFFNYGIALAPKYRFTTASQIGLYGFLPLVKDKAQSGYQLGINYTKAIKH